MNRQEQHNDGAPQTNDLFSALNDDQITNPEVTQNITEAPILDNTDVPEGHIRIKEVDDIETINEGIESLNNSISIVNENIRIINDSISKVDDFFDKEIEEYAKGFNEASLLAVYEPDRLETIRETLGSNNYNDGFKAARKYHAKENEPELLTTLKELEELREAAHDRENEMEI